MKMHLLSGGRLRMRKSIFQTAADKNETIELPVPCVLLRHAQGNVLFDTGCHPAVAEYAEARWGALARLMTPIMPPGENVVNGLSGIGLSCDDIDLVVCSHLHPDHCGCNIFFERATFIIHSKEVEAARAPGAQAQGYLAAEWQQDAPTDVIDDQRDVFGDGRIVLLPLPGHTPGTTSALVQLDRSGAFLLASDTVSLRSTLDTGMVPKNTWNADALARSLAEIRRFEAGGAKIICGHDAAEWTTLRKGADAYE
ncbi:MAG TPA: N-acyl homoserine lactonase family protein [Xanthobacteraceae bacterium]|nr:N-acyl homoserine lactonase family protein [Xanthobacteraceae bacterium]